MRHFTKLCVPTLALSLGACPRAGSNYTRSAESVASAPPANGSQPQAAATN